MKKTSKIIGYILILLAMLMIILLVNKLYSKKEAIVLADDNGISLTYKYSGKEFTIKGSKIKSDDIYHIFVPDFVDLDNLILPSNDFLITKGYYFNGVFTEDNDNKDIISQVVLIDNNHIKCYFHKLNNQTLFINLNSDHTLDEIHENKENKLPGHVLNLDISGNTLFNGELDYIKGRGNGTWEREKKSYSLVFNSLTSLCNMSNTRRYVLLSNFQDPTQMRNKIVYEFAKYIGMDNVVDSSYVNVYINGEYKGLYLLCSKLKTDVNVETVKNNHAELKTVTNVGGGYKRNKIF